MAGNRAPKQWSLTKNETITTSEAWKQNLQYTLSLDPNFAIFLVNGARWTKKTLANPRRCLANDGQDVPENSRGTAAQKVAHLELMLGQIANYCPIISRNTIVKNSTSIESIWQTIRIHFGFQSTGAHFLDFDNIHLDPGERTEDLFQKLTSFIEDNLLQRGGGISHMGALPKADEELSPSLENLITLTWLRLLHKDLPALVKQRYGPELRSKTLASLKPEISQALDSLLDEIRINNDTKVLRTAFKNYNSPPTTTQRHQNFRTKNNKICPLCKQAGRPRHDHFLSTCKFLPQEDKTFMSRARHLCALTNSDEDNFESTPEGDQLDPYEVAPTSRRVSTKQSPQMKAYYKQHILHITLDSGAEISMIRACVSQLMGIEITKSTQHTLQADGTTPLEIVGETHFDLTREDITFHVEALVVKDLDVDFPAGIPFLSANDISIRPARHETMIGNSHVIYYNTHDIRQQHHIRRAHAYVLKSPSTTVWPGSHLELDVPEHIPAEGTVAVEPRIEFRYAHDMWPKPEIIDVVAGKIRIVNNTGEPKQLKKNEHFCQVLPTTLVSDNNITDGLPNPVLGSQPTKNITREQTLSLRCC